LQHTATRCNALRHTATISCRLSLACAFSAARHLHALSRVQTYQHIVTRVSCALVHAFPRASLQHTATHCNTLQRTATHCNTLPPGALPCALTSQLCCSMLQCVALCCSVWQCTAVCCCVLQFVVHASLSASLRAFSLISNSLAFFSSPSPPHFLS